MNKIKNAFLGICAITSLLINELSSSMLNILDWLMMVTLSSENICSSCGKKDECISFHTPLCPECNTEAEECEDDDCQSDRLPNLKKDIMFR